ncbi:MAG: class I SAM-dependent DNA methyltransferase [Desulforhopalus sp.]
MLAPHIKKNVDKLWNRFWTAGITNPLVAVEQITYLLFLRRLEFIDNERVKKGRPSIYTTKVRVGKQEVDAEQCRWSYIKIDKTPQHLSDVVFPWLRDLEKHIAKASTPANGIEAIGNRMSDAYFQLDPNKGAILQEAIELIDELFERIDSVGATSDVMGDTFEYLLSEIATAGKNGQFRTPRHLIRCMVEMVEPKLGERIIDPAAGTGGFLFSSLNFLLSNKTDPEQLRIEWDGTPHRVYGDLLNEEEDAIIHKGDYLVGFDNDRTMVRIGWMNMILHGVENPEIHQRDSLGKRKEGDPFQSESFDVVLANPPFTGTVDSADLETTLFPKAGKRGKKATQAITNKSELLFVWLMLDLLQVGGRCAVIVPEGVLFGNTDGHTKLRRELLTEHLVEGVISLPGGVFQPYTGVKTSILVFQKETRKEDKGKWKQGDPPRTENVWFYEVSEEAFSLDAKRNERRGQDNDLWDMLVKFKTRYKPEQDELNYYQPQYRTERWRMVDAHTMATFSDDPRVVSEKDQIRSLAELFPDLPADPEKAYAKIINEQQPILDALALTVINNFASDVFKKAKTKKGTKQRTSMAEAAMKKAGSAFRSLCEKHKGLFENDEKIALSLYQKAYQTASLAAVEMYSSQIIDGTSIKHKDYDSAELTEALANVAYGFAKLDGYDVVLRTLDVFKHEGVLKYSKHWTAPVRVYAVNEEWQSEDGKIRGSHDENDVVRPEYIASIQLYDGKNHLIEALLDQDCIEARNWNLSAGQYKPFNFIGFKSDKSVVEMIRELQDQEKEIANGMSRLLAMVEGK